MVDNASYADRALFNAQFHMWRAARSGFSSDSGFSWHSLSGPLVGVVDPIVQPQPPRVWLSPDDAADLIWDLNGSSGRGLIHWCAAVIDDGHSAVLANDLAASQIPAGVHLPDNATVVIGEPGDGLFWQYYGWPPAERLIAYAQQYDWLHRITTLVAGTIPDYVEDRKRYISPFHWVRAMVGAKIDHIEFVEIDSAAHPTQRGPNGPRPAGHIPWGSPTRGGRHRLQVVNPIRYGQLAEQVAGGAESIRTTVHDAAKLTVLGAQRALTYCEHLLRPPHNHAALAVLHTVAGTEPADIAARRLGPVRERSHLTAIGLSSFDAPEWATLVRQATNTPLPSPAAQRYRAIRHDAETDPAAIAHYLEMDLRRNLLFDAIETIALWGADPLPIGDIDYVARFAADMWR